VGWPAARLGRLHPGSRPRWKGPSAPADAVEAAPALRPGRQGQQQNADNNRRALCRLPPLRRTSRRPDRQSRAAVQQRGPVVDRVTPTSSSCCGGPVYAAPQRPDSSGSRMPRSVSAQPATWSAGPVSIGAYFMASSSPVGTGSDAQLASVSSREHHF
jgi:hypothetical protein